MKALRAEARASREGEGEHKKVPAKKAKPTKTVKPPKTVKEKSAKPVKEKQVKAKNPVKVKPAKPTKETKSKKNSYQAKGAVKPHTPRRIKEGSFVEEELNVGQRVVNTLKLDPEVITGLQINQYPAKMLSVLLAMSTLR